MFFALKFSNISHEFQSLRSLAGLPTLAPSLVFICKISKLSQRGAQYRLPSFNTNSNWEKYSILFLITYDFAYLYQLLKWSAKTARNWKIEKKKVKMENIGRSGLVKPESFRRRASPHNEPLPKKTSQLRKLIGACRQKYLFVVPSFQIYLKVAMYFSFYLIINLFTYSFPHNDLHPTKKSTPLKFSSI